MRRSKVRVKWDSPPSVRIGGELRRRASGLRPALEALAMYHAAIAESEMKSRAEWTDRTTFARSSLFARPDGLTIYIGTTNEEYGLFLELGTRYMRPYPVITPQIEETGLAYWNDAVEIARSLLFGG